MVEILFGDSESEAMKVAKCKNAVEKGTGEVVCFQNRNIYSAGPNQGGGRFRKRVLLWKSDYQSRLTVWLACLSIWWYDTRTKCKI